MVFMFTNLADTLDIRSPYAFVIYKPDWGRYYILDISRNIPYVYRMETNIKDEFDADDLNLITLAQQYSDEDKARERFESWRWPGGKPICPHCKHDESYKVSYLPEDKAQSAQGPVLLCGSSSPAVSRRLSAR